MKVGYGFKIIIEGDYACFTRPEFKVERVSYDVPTPGAIEGLLKSVYWKPAIRYIVDKIIVYNPINFINIRRNEVNDKLKFSNVKAKIENNAKDISIYTKDSISQRATMFLKDVKYGIEFHFELTGQKSSNDDESEAKHYNIIKRRMEKGQAFRTPCLGTSECQVSKINIVEEFNLDDVSEENKSLGEVDLGFMSYAVKFQDEGRPLNNDWENPLFSDKATTLFYRPKMINGVIDVSEYREDIRG